MQSRLVERVIAALSLAMTRGEIVLINDTIASFLAMTPVFIDDTKQRRIRR
jgi:hypothetical protein